MVTSLLWRRTDASCHGFRLLWRSTQSLRNVKDEQNFNCLSIKSCGFGIIVHERKKWG
jgi:hypothetical protein